MPVAIASPKVMATPTWVTAPPEMELAMTAPHPAKTRMKTAIPSARYTPKRRPIWTMAVSTRRLIATLLLTHRLGQHIIVHASSRYGHPPPDSALQPQGGA